MNPIRKMVDQGVKYAAILACAKRFETMGELDVMIEESSRVLAIAVLASVCLELTDSACRLGLGSSPRHRIRELQLRRSATVALVSAT